MGGGDDTTGATAENTAATDGTSLPVASNARAVFAEAMDPRA